MPRPKHPRKEHSVKRDVRGFCGWPKLLEIVKRAERKSPKTYPKGFLPALIAALFETGGRVSEVLQLRPENFDLDSSPDFIVIKDMPLVKRKKKSAITSRTFPIKRSDPLCQVLVNWVNKCAPKKPLFLVSRSKVFVMVRSLGEDLYPHWFRAQRASQLALEHGLDASDLTEFFAWEHWPTALMYARRGYKGLMERMR